MNRLPFRLCVALWAGVFAWASTVTYFSSLSGSDLDGFFSTHLSDKVIHYAVFAGGGLLLTAALRSSFRWSPVVLALASTVALSAFGALDEWHQLHTPGRNGGDPGDWLADALGALSSSAALSCLYVRRNSRPLDAAPAGN